MKGKKKSGDVETEKSSGAALVEGASGEGEEDREEEVGTEERSLGVEESSWELVKEGEINCGTIALEHARLSPRNVCVMYTCMYIYAIYNAYYMSQSVYGEIFHEQANLFSRGIDFDEVEENAR